MFSRFIQCFFLYQKPCVHDLKKENEYILLSNVCLSAAKKVYETRISQTHKGSTDHQEHQSPSGRLSLKMFPKVTWELLRNAPFFFVMLTGGSEGIVTSGFATFAPKYIQNKFGVSSGTAAFYTGILTMEIWTNGLNTSQVEFSW